MQLNGKLTICRVMSNTSEDYIEIRVQDSSSSAQYCTVQVSFENFAQALTGLASVECLHNAQGLSVIGKTRENKSVIVKVPDAILEPALDIIRGGRESLVNLVEFVKSQVELDGWELWSNFNDILNRRNWKKKNGEFTPISVTVVRYV